MDLQLPVPQTSSSQNAFSLMLAKNLTSTEAKNCNLVFSPLSIHVVLSLTAAGSEGPTRDQILSFLNAQSVDDLNTLSSYLFNSVFADRSHSGGPILSFANGIWFDQSLILKPSFNSIVNDVYKAACNQVDFQNKHMGVMKEVNLWTEKETNGLIKEILPPGSLDTATRVILGNALYFKGTWKEEFDASKTKEHEFHLFNGSSIQAPFMTSNEKQYLSAFDSFKVLRLPYAQGEDKRCFSMYIFLPDARDGLPALVDRIGSESGFLEHHLPTWKVKVGEFLIPKFKISFGFEASKLLKKLGLVLPFSGEGLTEMVECSGGGKTQGLCVSKIFHKSFIEVNEEGTEAAGASTVVMTWRCSVIYEDSINFVADHPFLYVIREDISGMILFVGSVQDPVS